MNSTRGVVWIVWGEKADGVLARSRESVKRTNPELAQKVFRLEVTDPVLGLAEKARMFDLSPFDETLFLDADTVALGKLDFAFEKAAKHGLACCFSAAPWARRYMGGGLPPDSLEMNTGVVAFNRHPATKAVFDAWKRFAGVAGETPMDTSILWVKDQSSGELVRMAANDQGSFAAALEETGFCPFVLPLNWNMHADYCSDWFGPVRIWHSYSAPPQHVIEAAAYYERPGSVIQHHRLDGTRVPHPILVASTTIEAEKQAAADQREFLAFSDTMRQHSRAQLQQDLWVLFETGSKREGFFVEFGATNGRDISNTLLLEDQFGWRGILSEPLPSWHEALMREGNRPASAKDLRCVWSRTGDRLTFTATTLGELAGVTSTLAKDANTPARSQHELIEVDTVSLVDLLKSHQAPSDVDFLSINTEGSELEILRAFFADPQGFRFKLIAVEHNFTSAEKAIDGLLVSSGYERRFTPLSRWDAWYRLKARSESNGMAPQQPTAAATTSKITQGRAVLKTVPMNHPSEIMSAYTETDAEDIHLGLFDLIES